MWDGQVPAFAARYRVIRYDAQGFGRSPMASAPAARAADLFRLLTELGISRAHLVGLSMGGATAIDFTLLHPEMVGALVLAASGLSGSERADAWLEEQDRQEEAAVQRGDLDLALRVDLQTWLAGPRRRLEDLDRGLVEMLAPMARDVLAHDAQRPPTPQLDPPAVGRLHQIHAPTLVLVGDADVDVMIEIAELLATQIPRARKQVFANTAHLLNLERPAEFTAAVLSFLDEHPLAGALSTD
jgi:pimeloyl-ACP methyl ester carboxylesterase